MKKLGLGIMFLSFLARGQFYPLLDDWSNNFLSMQTSPYVMPARKFVVSFPGAGNSSVFWRNPSVNLYALFGPESDFNKNLRTILEQTDPHEGIFGDVRQEWLHAGFFAGNHFIHFGADTEWQFWLFHPVSVYRALLDGINIDTPPVKLKEIHLQVQALTRFSVGIAKSPSPRFAWGLTLHLYSSGLYVSSLHDGGAIFVERQEPGYTVYLQNIRLQLHSAGIRSLYEEEHVGTPDVDPEGVQYRLMRNLAGGKNVGLGFDYGFSTEFSPGWQFHASLLDLGFVYYYDDTYNYLLRGSYIYKGLEVDFDDTKDYWKNLADDFSKHVYKKENTGGFLTATDFKFYTGLKKVFGRNPVARERIPCPGEKARQEDMPGETSMGIIAFYNHLKGKAYAGVSAYGQVHLFRMADVRVTYGYETFLRHKVGVALLLRAGPWHIYAGAYNPLDFKDLSKTQGFSMRVGTYFAF